MAGQDRVAFISDADSDSGRAIANRFAREGVRLALHLSTDGSAVRQDMEDYAALGTDVLVTAGPLHDRGTTEDVLHQVLRKFGRVDILIHNHNVVESVRVEDCDEETYGRLMDENARTAFLCTQALGRQMAAQGAGRIVYVSSIHDEKPTGSSFVYAVAKGAVKMLCREAALELGRSGVAVNLIEMGPVDGDDARFASDLSDVYLNYPYKTPSGAGTYGDLAHLAWFLTLDESRYLNGASIRLDGGFVLHYMDHKMKRAESGRGGN